MSYYFYHVKYSLVLGQVLILVKNVIKVLDFESLRKGIRCSSFYRSRYVILAQFPPFILYQDALSLVEPRSMKYSKKDFFRESGFHELILVLLNLFFPDHNAAGMPTYGLQPC